MTAQAMTTLNRDPLFPHTHESEASCAICWWLRKKAKVSMRSQAKVMYSGATAPEVEGSSAVFITNERISLGHD